ncbi:uncharacterized protein MYCFIDRAFT_173549 [Pseudocercospora fijiensis CIRAD86]|uniref:Uncharacterized protein n=1 Tax=Pseudocercospora fijiensis (strain CIRAD86) TaxID=383855 RepID=M3A096_PSEFD|nr:uncharacterized protein MYCFIDRAFT_173549 [Pseudocercospora fijiensis CIRAD86]EME84589.1 hypothetical protein MYCFIDRAFT_173549 [Pseudocercospora fijiensis CIRAD86]
MNNAGVNGSAAMEREGDGSASDSSSKTRRRPGEALPAAVRCPENQLVNGWVAALLVKAEVEANGNGNGNGNGSGSGSGRGYTKAIQREQDHDSQFTMHFHTAQTPLALAAVLFAPSPSPSPSTSNWASQVRHPYACHLLRHIIFSSHRGQDRGRQASLCLSTDPSSSPNRHHAELYFALNNAHPLHTKSLNRLCIRSLDGPWEGEGGGRRGRRKAEGGRRKAEGGRRKAEGGRRKAEGGRTSATLRSAPMAGRARAPPFHRSLYRHASPAQPNPTQPRQPFHHRPCTALRLIMLLPLITLCFLVSPEFEELHACHLVRPSTFLRRARLPTARHLVQNYRHTEESASPTQPWKRVAVPPLKHSRPKHKPPRHLHNSSCRPCMIDPQTLTCAKWHTLYQSRFESPRVPQPQTVLQTLRTSSSMIASVVINSEQSAVHKNRQEKP